MSTATETTPPVETPLPPRPPRLDVRSVVERLKLPGVDPQKLLEAHHKDIEALLAANERAFVAIEALTRKQVDLLVHILKEWQASVRDTVSTSSGAEKINQVGTRIHNSFSHALTTMREMAEIASQSGQDVVSILNKRYREGLETFRKNISPKS